MVSNFVLGVTVLLVLFLSLAIMSTVVLSLFLGFVVWWLNSQIKTNKLLQAEVDYYEDSKYIINNINDIIDGLATIETIIKEIYSMNIYTDEPIIKSLMQEIGELLNKIEGISALSKLED